jgi:hypothetical protein
MKHGRAHCAEVSKHRNATKTLREPRLAYRTAPSVLSVHARHSIAPHNENHTQTIAPIIAHTQPLHQVPQHQHPPHLHPRITPTPTPHRTPIHPLHAPKHLLHTIPLPQRPSICRHTPQRPHTRRIPSRLTHTRLHPHHTQLSHLLHTRQQPTPIPVHAVPHQQCCRTRHPTAIPIQPRRQQPPLVRIRPTQRRPNHPTPTPPRQYTNTTAFRCERMRRISAPPTKLCIKRRVEPYSCAIHQHHRRRKRRVGDLLGDALRCQPTQQRVPAFVRNGLQAVQQGAQSGHRLVRQSFWGEAKEQLAIRGASGSAQQGEGEDEGFGVEGLASFGVRAWMVLGELQDGVIDGACGQGAARDGSVLAFRWVEWTQPHSYFRTPSTPLDKP